MKNNMTRDRWMFNSASVIYKYSCLDEDCSPLHLYYSGTITLHNPGNYQWT